MKKQLGHILMRLRNPVVVLSIASNLLAFFILIGYKIDESLVMSGVTIVCSILVTLGIMCNPTPKGYGNGIIDCATCKEKTLHTQVKNSLLCTECGGLYKNASDG